MQHISSLFKEIEKPKTKIISERAELVKFFVDNLYGRDKIKFDARRIAVKLAHVPTKDLYYMKSVFLDILKRKDTDSAQKWFWWSLKINDKKPT